ncbi:hypothetical protein F5Y09DRAFT_350328 [Xylaria sp. FL1042]|nr:hypothetical protein F5Y09DRAFT_350328 [Xylaria sp. FL1042]
MVLIAVQVFRLDVEALFERLTKREKSYAHHIARRASRYFNTKVYCRCRLSVLRAAWFGTSIILRQVSSESSAIYHFILELFRSCSGNRDGLIEPGVSGEEVHSFLTYAATFLSNLGNYFAWGSRDQKSMPATDASVLRKLAARSPRLSELYAEMTSLIFAVPPYSLGYPSKATRGSYYPGSNSIAEQEISMVSKTLEHNSISPENTRVRKSGNGTGFEVLIASVEKNTCHGFSESGKYAANDLQRNFLHAYIEEVQTGSLGTCRDALRLQARDKGPNIEKTFSFVEPCRDPHVSRKNNAVDAR